MKRGKTAAVREREEYIVELLKAEHGESISGSTFDRDLGISPSVRSNTISQLRKRYPQIKNTTPIGTEATYAWIEPEPAVAEEPKQASNKELRKIQAGEVWAASESNGSRVMVYVLSQPINGSIQCIKLYTETVNKMGKIGQDYFQVQIGKNSYIGDPSRVSPKPVKYLLCKEADADGVKLLEARWMLARIFGIKTQEPIPKEVVVEKEVIKEVKIDPNPELEAENHDLKQHVLELQNKIYDLENKVPEPEPDPNNYIDCRTARIAILTQERDVWRTVAMKLLDKGGGVD